MPGKNTLDPQQQQQQRAGTSRLQSSSSQSSSIGAPPLLEELERELKLLIKKFDLIAVTICDREGAFLLKLLNEQKPDGLFQLTMLNQKLINSCENIQKIELGIPRKILLEYDRYQIIKFINYKFIIAFVATTQTPTGTLFSLESDSNVIFKILKDYFD